MNTGESQQPSPGTRQPGGGQFISEGVEVMWNLTTDGLSWTTSSAETNTVSLEWSDVIRCHRGAVSARKPLEAPEAPDNDNSFTVHYTQKRNNHVLRHGYKVFQTNVHNVKDVLSITCEKSKRNRPRRLMVLINPGGGAGKGETVYKRIVAPLFKLAEIETDVIVSKNPEHTEEIGSTYDFSTVDGVVITGGNGTFQRLIHTWLPRRQKEAGINMSDPNSKLKSLPCAVGMIPTGTGNGLAIGEYYTDDVITAALHIITGRKTVKHLGAITSCGSLIGFSGLVVGNGSWCDMLDGENDYRWMGALRYPILASKLLRKKRREFNIKLEYLPYVPPKDGHPPEHNPSQLEWESVEGTFTGVVSFPGLLLQDDSSGAARVDPHNEGMTLCLEKQCGQLKYFSWLFKLQNFRKDMFDADFVTSKRVTAYKLKIVYKNAVNGDHHEEHERLKDKRCRSDGELHPLEKPQIEVRILPKVMQMFGTGQ